MTLGAARIPYAIRDESQSTVGWGRTATLHATYDRIVEVFGQPDRTPSGDGKVDAEWNLRTVFGPACIHNYKDGPSYVDGARVEDIDTWSVGGPSGATAAAVKEVKEA